MTDRPPFDPISVSPLSFWQQTSEEREKSFKVLRDERPISWHAPLEGALMEAEQDGFWLATRHEHVTAISKTPELFCSGEGVMIEEVPGDILEAAQSFLAMDAPRHARLRRLVSVAFTPRQVAKISDRIQKRAVHIVDDLLEHPTGDFVEQVSKQLPMWTIYEMIGLPEELRDEAAHNADGMVSWADEDVANGREPGEVLNDSLVGLITTAYGQIEERRSAPRDDLMTNLVQAEVDGVHLTDDEIASFFVLLSVAGNDTTRNTTTFGMRALCDFPGERERLAKDVDSLIEPAVEEIIRWTSPVMTFRRTATQDTSLAGQAISAGDWVVTMFASANMDERVFEDPYRFDVGRTPNKHVGFGGGGPHFCLGNMLARTQLRSLFTELVTRAPKLTLGESDYLDGNFVRAIKSVQYVLEG